MKIARVEAIPVRLSRARDGALGTAGSPTALSGPPARFRRSDRVGALYAEDFETALVKVTLDSGLAGWGEAQAPLAPEVACTIADLLLRPVLEGAEFDGSRGAIEWLWERMYSTMRVRGQTGGFMLDAISGVDLALWDLAGRMAGQPVAALIAGAPARERVPAYLSGVWGADPEERLEWTRPYAEAGFRAVKLFFDGEPEPLLETARLLRSRRGWEVAVDALWRLTPETAGEFGRRLDELGARWLEAPLPPEDPLAHAALARTISTPLALGESYRTRIELAPFFRAGALRIVQPDLGRCGITEGLRIAEMARAHGALVVPHVSIALGPQIAAAIHYAAALDLCPLLEFNPSVLAVANQFLETPLELAAAHYVVPSAPGLGAEVREAEIRKANQLP
jgi:galactonate dehydratase